MRNRRGSITLADLRAEGVKEVARAEGTSVLFVWTQKSLRIFHSGELPRRALDDYAYNLAVAWIDNGCSATWVARCLDLELDWLLKELARHGYVFKSRVDGKERKGANTRLRAERAANGRKKPSKQTGYGFASRSS